MSKNHKQLIKMVDEFKKTAEKERARLQEFGQKSEKFYGLGWDHPVVRQFADRIDQKDKQLAEDISWAEQFVGDLEAEFPKAKEAETPKQKLKEDKRPKQKSKKSNPAPKHT